MGRARAAHPPLFFLGIFYLPVIPRTVYIQPAPNQKLGACPSFLDLSHLPSTHGSFCAATPRNVFMWAGLIDISFCHCHTNL